MAAKSTSRFVCQSCGDAFLRWEGQCRSCGGWNSLVETVVRERSGPARGRPDGIAVGSGRAPVALADISETDVPRLRTGLAELDRVLGGGLVPGSVVLVGGEPGIGKSTLLLQVAAGLGRPVLYATGEESAAQVRLRAGRLNLLDGQPGRHRPSGAWTSLDAARRARDRVDSAVSQKLRQRKNLKHLCWPIRCAA